MSTFEALSSLSSPGGAAPGKAIQNAQQFLPEPRAAESARDRAGKMAATDRSRSEAAKQRRQDQLQRWLGSETDQTGPETRETSTGSGARRAKVRFAQGAVFMAACSAGDQEEVAALLRQGADINLANIDGLTALHQVRGLFSELDRHLEFITLLHTITASATVVTMYLLPNENMRNYPISSVTSTHRVGL